VNVPSRACRLAAITAAALLGVGALRAQNPPGRPRLARPGDVNDWTAFFDYGAAVLRSQPHLADSAFYWASRLDPSRAEPLFGRWVAFWVEDLGRFQEYLDDRPKTLQSPAVLRADSLYLRALQRNPFVPQNLRIVPYDMLGGRWREDPGTQGWLAYARGDYERAAERFSRLIARNPDKYVTVHFYRALAFIPLRRYDSAGAEMQAFITTLRRIDSTGTTSPVYESKEMVEYGIGLLALVRGDNAAARAAFERALQENLGFVPAHVRLGDLALARRDGAAAAGEYAQAVELAPSDGWIRSRYGVVLSTMGRWSDAVAQLRQAIELEPYFADPYLTLGGALEATGDRAGAMRALEDFLARAPRSATEQMETAQRHLTALRSRGGGP
jgi:tetratricopeptide (TPR) repeat protein